MKTAVTFKIGREKTNDSPSIIHFATLHPKWPSTSPQQQESKNTSPAPKRAAAPSPGSRHYISICSNRDLRTRAPSTKHQAPSTKHQALSPDSLSQQSRPNLGTNTSTTHCCQAQKQSRPHQSWGRFQLLEIQIVACSSSCHPSPKMLKTFIFSNNFCEVRNWGCYDLDIKTELRFIRTPCQGYFKHNWYYWDIFCLLLLILSIICCVADHLKILSKGKML